MHYIDNTSSDHIRAYFDCNATTPPHELAINAAIAAMKETFGNPSSTHITGLQAKQLLDSARGNAAAAIGCEASQIIFTSGATEGIQMAVFSALCEARRRITAGETLPQKLLYGATEHKAVSHALTHWNAILGMNFEIEKIPVHSNGRLDLDFIMQAAPHSWMICTMAVNNETGVFQELHALESVIRNANPNVLWLVDCVQALGKLPLTLSATTIDYAVFSGHKLYSPKGIGFFYCRRKAPFVPLIVGGGQEQGQRSGTENLPGVAAMNAMMQALCDRTTNIFASHDVLNSYRTKLATTIKEVFNEVLFNAAFDISVPTTLNFTIPGYLSSEIMNLFDAAGLRVSSGSACSAKNAHYSHVLEAMDLPDWRCAGAIRLSFGPATTAEEIESGCAAIRKAGEALAQACLPVKSCININTPRIRADGPVQFHESGHNSWIFANSDTNKCVVIDPSIGLLERMKRFVRCQNFTVEAILFTSQDAIITSAIPIFEQAFSPLHRIAFEDSDKLLLGVSSRFGHLEIGISAVKYEHSSSDEKAYIVSNGPAANNALFVFTGHLVVPFGIGYALNCKDPAQFAAINIKQLHPHLAQQTVICPRIEPHDHSLTTWGLELRHNELIQSIVFSEPACAEHILQSRIQEQIDEPLFENETWISSDSFLNAQDNCFLARDEIEQRLQKNALLIIDVRESYEYACPCDQGFGAPQGRTLNVPMSQFATFLADLFANHYAGAEFCFLCRSGKRAVQAAQLMRLLGYSNSFALEGGLAFGFMTRS